MKYSYNWLKWYIPGVPAAEKLAEVLAYHLAEVESLTPLLVEEGAGGGDYILDIKILPNRAHDLLSHMGLARELASLLQIKYNDPTEKYKIPEFKPTSLKIKIDTDKCKRYMGRIVRNVKVGPSPNWVVNHLKSIGQRSINNLVDAANLVMFDSGQPIHCFDLDKISGGGLVVRQAKDGEKMTTLDNREIRLNSRDIVIADNKNVLGLAGIKGGRIAEVDNNTKNIIIEVANFDPISTRKSARGHGIFTDAAKRFENELTPELGDYVMREMSGLLVEFGTGEFEDIVDVYPQKPKARTLVFSAEKVCKVLGLEVSEEAIEDILKRYNILYKNDRGEFEISVPPLRLDLTIEEDMAEEIGRVLGYDKIKETIPKINFEPKQNEMYAKIVWARNKLLSEGYSEVMTSSFAMKGEVEVLASASDKNFLRTNLSDGLKESMKLNQANAPLLGMENIKIFEVGTIFEKGVEKVRVAFGDEKVIKEMTLEEYNLSPALPKGEGAPSPLEKAGEEVDAGGGNFKMWSLYPFITRDIAVWVPAEVESEKVSKVIKDNAGEIVVRGPELFDTFTKNNKTSHAFRIVFQSYDRTLTDAEVNDIMQKISEKLKSSDWEVR